MTLKLRSQRTRDVVISTNEFHSEILSAACAEFCPGFEINETTSRQNPIVPTTLLFFCRVLRVLGPKMELGLGTGVRIHTPLDFLRIFKKSSDLEF